MNSNASLYYVLPFLKNSNLAKTTKCFVLLNNLFIVYLLLDGAFGSHCFFDEPDVDSEEMPYSTSCDDRTTGKKIFCITL